MKTSQKDKKPHHKLIIIGDGAVGKTSLLHTFHTGTFPLHYIPTLYEQCVADMEIDGFEIEVELQDIGGQEYYDRLRVLDYMRVDVVLLAFAIDDQQSLDNIENKWIDDATMSLEKCKIKHKVPRVLVGCKKDLQDDPLTITKLSQLSMSPVSSQEAAAFAAKFHCDAYVECSALRSEGVREVFETAMRLVLAERRRKRCVIL